MGQPIYGAEWPDPIIIGLNINEFDPIWAMWANGLARLISFFVFPSVVQYFLCHFEVLVPYNYQIY
jgi:hypothetical protein